jgi:hypothetical protein
MSLVVDDHLLLDLLLGSPSPWLAGESERGPIYTTGSWYYRVGLAVMRGSGAGAISRRIAALDADAQYRVLEWLGKLPDWIGLLGPRLLVPVMAGLDTRSQPNLLCADALAVALVTESGIAVATESPLLRACSQDLGIAYHLDVAR